MLGCLIYSERRIVRSHLEFSFQRARGATCLTRSWPPSEPPRDCSTRDEASSSVVSGRASGFRVPFRTLPSFVHLFVLYTLVLCAVCVELLMRFVTRFFHHVIDRLRERLIVR